jgi:hypothetical protein
MPPHFRQECQRQVLLPQGPQAVQTGSNIVNGEELLNLAPSHVNLDPLLMPFSNELDIFVSQNTKEKIWNMGYIDLAILLPVFINGSSYWSSPRHV